MSKLLVGFTDVVCPAGIETNLKDENGDTLYTGDIVYVQENTPIQFILIDMEDKKSFVNGFYGRKEIGPIKRLMSYKELRPNLFVGGVTYMEVKKENPLDMIILTLGTQNEKQIKKVIEDKNTFIDEALMLADLNSPGNVFVKGLNNEIKFFTREFVMEVLIKKMEKGKEFEVQEFIKTEREGMN